MKMMFLYYQTTRVCRNKKCPWCPFYDKCMNKDNETDKAKEMANEVDLLDISGVVDFKPVVENSGDR